MGPKWLNMEIKYFERGKASDKGDFSIIFLKRVDEKIERKDVKSLSNPREKSIQWAVNGLKNKTKF